ncbi:acetoin reductase [Gluconobacter kondonii]|uniref:acetoin reductase n=1 Tax=Gluconobacter kondonii TaxID=941463 RepID=UPI001B8D4578|nr:acetoin reductase [Gluconobacter kondonii]MBS1066293.1 acetoin reductase [Gluconobacter kondonii]MBS1081923.1 acetoin reductase [Gluconobacter kondonii]
MSLSGKVAAVTGAAQGIGKAIALRLAKDGADVILLDVKQDILVQTAKEVEALGRRAVALTADISNRDQFATTLREAADTLGGLDIMVNNAGICQVKPVLEIEPAEIEKIFSINVQGVLWGIQAAAKIFQEKGTKGKIINACSIAGHEGYPLLGAYSATKFAVRALTQSAAKELASSGITVNSYCPGIVGTDMWVTIDQRMAEITGANVGATYKKYVEGIALGRVETANDVAGFVAYLSSSDADYMTGQSVLIDGGLVFR